MTGTNRCVFLMGIKHCGKTTIGRRLAAKKGYRFVDLDDRILELAKNRRGAAYRSVREVYRALGRDGFQAIEAEAAATVVQQHGHSRTCRVVALGGGTIENRAAMRHLEGNGIFLYLVQDEATLFGRILAGGLPPFLDTEDPRATFGELFRRRDAMYRERADRLVDIRNMAIADALTAVVQSIER